MGASSAAHAAVVIITTLQHRNQAGVWQLQQLRAKLLGDQPMVQQQPKHNNNYELSAPAVQLQGV
jgi:hypothetical protein